MELMAAASNLIAIYLALETASIAFYALVGFLKDRKSTESALKYLLLSATASAVFVYGLSFVFGYTGAVNLPDIAASVQAQILSQNTGPGLFLGIVLVLAGLGFKMAVFPFQFWVPDVYEGAPTPITLYLSVASKWAGFALFVRLFFRSFFWRADAYTFLGIDSLCHFPPRHDGRESSGHPSD